MTDCSKTDEMRNRLYQAYATTHAGTSQPKSASLAFRQYIAPHLPAQRAVDVLDLGCGQGQMVRQLVQDGYCNARGIDISPEQVQIAHESGVPQVRHGDYRETLLENSLDVVIATDFFEHLTKYDALDAFDRIFWALRSPGVLIIRVPNAASPFSGIYRYGDVTHELSFTARSIRQLGAAAGYEKINCYPCLPPVHGVKSMSRRVLWTVASGCMKLALASETGATRGHLVTQNIVAVIAKNPCAPITCNEVPAK